MTIEKVEGIILSDTNYSESSKILNVFTKEYGVIGILSKGCRTMKSKLRGVSQKFTFGDFHIYYKETGLSTLISVDCKKNFSHILSDIEKISYLSFATELITQVMRQTEDNEIYDLYRAYLLKLEDGIDPLVLTNILELKLLEFLGVRPFIDGCSVCGSQGAIVTINTVAGGYLCKNCYRNEKIYSDKLIKLVRMFYYVDIEKISKLEVSAPVRKELNEFIDEYYEHYTGLYLRSKKFLQNLNKIG